MKQMIFIKQHVISIEDIVHVSAETVCRGAHECTHFIINLRGGLQLDITYIDDHESFDHDYNRLTSLFEVI